MRYLKLYESFDKISKLYNIIKKLENYLKNSIAIPDIKKVFTSQGFIAETVDTLIKYVKWISVPNPKYPNVYKWIKLGEVNMDDIIWLFDKIEECKIIIRDIEETKKEDIKSWKGHGGRTDKKILKYLRFLLELKLNYSVPNDESISDLIKDIKAFSQIETTLRRRGFLIKNADKKWKFIFDGIPNLDDAIELDINADKDIEEYSIRESSVKKVLELLKYLYENYRDGNYLPSNYEKKFGVANEIHNIIQQMGLLKNISSEVKKIAFYQYMGEEPTIELARTIFEKAKDSFLNLDKAVGEKHISNYNDFLNENEEQKIVLDSICYAENSKYDYRWVLKVNTENPLKSVLKVEQLLSEWRGTPGQWYVGTLLGVDGFGGNGRMSDKISIDFGQNWSVAGLIEALEEVKKILNLK